MNILGGLSGGGKIHEILASGQPPGLCGSMARMDPTHPDVAVPKAFRKLEETQSAREIAKGAGFSVNTIRQTWKI